MEAVTDTLFLGSKITVDDDCNHEIKRRLLLVRKATANLDSILKSRDTKKNNNKKQRHHFDDKGPYSQSYGFSSSHVRM